MSEGWPAQVVKETGVLGSDAAAEASHVAGKASEAVKGSAHAVQGTVTGVRHRLAPSIPLLHPPPPPPPPPPPLRQPNSICCRTLSLVFPSHLYVFPVTCAATTQLACYSADSACIHYHSLQAQVGKPCSYDQLHDASLVMPSESLQDAFSLTTACGLLEPHTLCAHCGFVTSLEPHTLC